MKNLNASVPVVNLVPKGEGSGFPYGQDIAAGENLEDRMVLLGQLGDVYLTVEGGPVVAKEAKAASARGAAILPLVSSGGASAGMFDFPASALRRPNFATEAQWQALRAPGNPQATAKAVVEMVSVLVQHVAKDVRPAS